MRDFNFFSDYVYVKQTFTFKKLILPVFYTILIGAMVAGYFYIENKRVELSDEFDTKQGIVTSDKYKATMATFELLKNDIETLNLVQQDAGLFEVLMDYKFPVTDELISRILTSVPRNVSFESYAIDARGIHINCITTEYTYIAEMEHNIRQLGLFDRVFVNVISDDDEEKFTFSIILEFGGGF